MNLKITYLLNFTLLFIPFLLTSQNISWTNYPINDSADDTRNTGVSTALATYNNLIYSTYIGLDAGMYVSQFDPSTNTKTNTKVLNDVALNAYHVKPSIAVDKNGYIHVSGNMHNDAWVYFISDSPEDVSSFSSVASEIPGNFITYQEFYVDNNGALYITFRQRRTEGGGDHRGGLIRYHADTQTFEMLGGITYSDEGFETTNPCILWGLGFGGQGNWYQQPRIHLHFDEDNKMHLIASIIGENIDQFDDANDFNNQTHVLYAYSNDGGYNFFKADGTAIASLPLTVNNASIVEERLNENDITPSFQNVTAFGTNKPVVIFRTLDTSPTVRAKMWNGSTWQEISIGNEENPGTLSTCRKNVCVYFKPFVLNGFGDGRFQVTRDEGQNWRELRAMNTANVPRQRLSISPSFFKETGDFVAHHISDFGAGNYQSDVHFFNLSDYTSEIQQNTAEKTTTTFTIDGILDEVDWTLSSSITKVLEDKFSNNVTNYQLLWDNSNLYVAVQVTDATLSNTTGNNADNDGIAIYIDADNSKSFSYDSSNDFEYLIPYNGVLQVGTNSVDNTTGVSYAFNTNTEGYSFEIAIPWTTLGVTPSSLNKIGFDLVVNDDDDGSVPRESRTAWSGAPDNSDHTDLWGVVELSEYTLSADEFLFSDSDLKIFTLTNNQFDVVFNYSFDSPVYIAIYNLMGQLLKYKTVSKSSLNSYKVKLDMSKATSGIYIVKIGDRSGSFYKTRKIIVKQL